MQRLAANFAATLQNPRRLPPPNGLQVEGGDPHPLQSGLETPLYVNRPEDRRGRA